MKNYIKLQNHFLDGTKIEANANKYSFVWNKSVRNYDRKLDEKLKNHLREIDRTVAEENQIYLEEDLEEKREHTRITTEQVTAVVESIDKKLKQEPGNKQLKKKSKEFKKDILPRKQKYEKSLVYISDKLTILHGQSDHLSRRFRSLISERYSR